MTREICDLCKLTVEDNQDGLLCEACLGWKHRECISMTKKTYQRISKTQEPWICDGCIAKKNDKKGRTNRNITLEDIMDKLESMEQKYSDLLSKYEEQKKINDTVQQELKDVKKELNKWEQSKLINNMLVQGVPLKENENLQEVVKQIGQYLDAPIRKRFTAYRLGKNNNSPIKIEFEDGNEKKQMMISKKRLQMESRNLGFPNSNKIYLNHELTKGNVKLHTAARLFKKQHNYKFLWIHDGNIFIRKNENSRIILVDNEDVLKDL